MSATTGVAVVICVTAACGRSPSADPSPSAQRPNDVQLTVGRRGWHFYASNVGHRRPYFAPVRSGDPVPLTIGPAGGHFAFLVLRVTGGVPRCPAEPTGRAGCTVKTAIRAKARPELDVTLQTTTRFELIDGGLEGRLMIPLPPSPIEPADAELSVALLAAGRSEQWTAAVHLVEGCDRLSTDCAPMQFCADGLCEPCTVECAAGAVDSTRALECHHYGRECTAWVEPPPS